MEIFEIHSLMLERGSLLEAPWKPSAMLEMPLDVQPTDHMVDITRIRVQASH